MSAANGTTNILVVDDEAFVRDITCRWLTGEGYQCAAAESGESALKLLRADDYDLVVSDIRMDGISGVELLEQAKQVQPGIAFLMCTAVHDVQGATHCLKAGAYGYVFKPFDRDAIVIAVTAALQRLGLERKNRQHEEELEHALEDQGREMRRVSVGAISALALTMEARDPFMRGHSERMADLALRLAETQRVPDEDAESLRLAALLHDLGMMGVSDAIVHKPQELSEEETKIIRTHPEKAVEILSPLITDGRILSAILHHHERYDGQGYPAGLSGSDIPLWARILAVADAYDAMVSPRPWRPKMSVADACDVLRAGKTAHWDPLVVEAILAFVAYEKN